MRESTRSVVKNTIVDLNVMGTPSVFDKLHVYVMCCFTDYSMQHVCTSLSCQHTHVLALFVSAFRFCISRNEQSISSIWGFWKRLKRQGQIQTICNTCQSSTLYIILSIFSQELFFLHHFTLLSSDSVRIPFTSQLTGGFAHLK